MEAQGYQVQDNILFQDNKSAILLEKNGKASSSKHTKHVKVLCSGSSETKSWEWFLHRIQDQENPKR
jgi:hypothetical protein